MSAFGKYPPPRNFNNIPSGFPVCTVVSYKPDGKFIPLSFGVVMNDERFRYQISVIHRTMENGNNITFECSYKDSGRLQTVLLRFSVKECLWAVG
jgi:hypothetical protein